MKLGTSFKAGWSNVTLCTHGSFSVCIVYIVVTKVCKSVY